MNGKHFFSAAILTVMFVVSAVMHAQVQRPATWADDLTYLQSASTAGKADQATLDDIRTAVETWLKAHPESGIKLAPAPPQPWNAEQFRNQVSVLQRAVDTILKEDPNRPFHLGLTEVNVSANVSPLAPSPISPVVSSIDETEMANQNATRVSQALTYLPGVEIQHLAMNRNEAGIMVRGFSTRGQVPLYLDGIPIYVPYDGYVDLNRFLTGNLAEVQVAKGYTSPLMGPNGLGGSINLVTQEPIKKYEAEALMGTGSGNALLSSLNLGTRWSHFFAQGTVDWLQNDYTPLPGDAPVLHYAKLPDITMSDEQNGSYSQDARYTGRFGYTPKGQDEYVFSFINQKGEKGVPLYAGNNTNATYNNFWEWPYWNKTSYYFLSNTGLGAASSIKFRAFYDQFQNQINMYSNDTYSVMNTKNAEHSFYDDHTDGFSTEFTSRLVPRNALSGSFFFKDDTHREHGIYPGMSPYPLVEPDLVDRAQQYSIGAQDLLTLTSRLHATAGFSADHLDGLQGQSYNSKLTGLVPFTCLASPSNTSFAGCTAHVWNFNPQASASYALTEADSLFLTFADRSRFPMLKDIYSASMGSGLPNPNLQPEHSYNWNLGYSRTFASKKTFVKVEFFHDNVHDAIESVYVTDPGGTTPATRYCPNSKITGYCTTMVNIGNEIHEGVEFEVHSTPISRLTVDASYSYLNRNLDYDFVGFPNVSTVNTSVQVLPTLPRNKFVGTASVRLPHQILALVTGRYEGGLTVQDTTYPSTSPLYQPYGESFGTMDLGVVAPIRYGMSLQAGLKNVFDQYYYYTAGYPELGRNWYFNVRYRF